MACICQETLPHKQRGNVRFPEPSGWTYNEEENAKAYKIGETDITSLVPCHLIGYGLIGDDTMQENFFTATPSAQSTMAIYERQAESYVQRTGDHVMYRATPVFYQDNLMAEGVQLEAYSVEDNGEGINFNVFVYNVEPGVVYDYATGQNQLVGKIN